MAGEGCLGTPAGAWPRCRVRMEPPVSQAAGRATAQARRVEGKAISLLSMAPRLPTNTQAQHLSLQMSPGEAQPSPPAPAGTYCP